MEEKLYYPVHYRDYADGSYKAWLGEAKKAKKLSKMKKELIILYQFCCINNGRGGRNRTRNNGFGDRCYTI